jgi:DNA topoisomerase-1
VVEKRTKKGKLFYGCSRWPECDFATWDKPYTVTEKGKIVVKTCPKCNSALVTTKRKQIRCSNKKCDFQLTDKK